jgi:hypothetical protein
MYTGTVFSTTEPTWSDTVIVHCNPHQQILFSTKIISILFSHIRVSLSSAVSKTFPL